MSQSFDAYYFRYGCGQPYERTPAWLNFFSEIARTIQQTIAPRTALDAGCAMGFLVEGLRDVGIEAYGVDISSYAIQQVRADIQPFCWVGSLTEPLPQKYDLIISIEVLEHIPKRESERALLNLCQATDDIVFSSTPLDYREATHFNVQSPDDWAEQFARQGFVRDVDYDASFITPWAARYRRSHEPLPRVVQAYERRFWELKKENHDLRSLVVEMRSQLAAQEQTLNALHAQLADLSSLSPLRRLRRWLSRK